MKLEELMGALNEHFKDRDSEEYIDIEDLSIALNQVHHNSFSRNKEDLLEELEEYDV